MFFALACSTLSSGLVLVALMLQIVLLCIELMLPSLEAALSIGIDATPLLPTGSEALWVERVLPVLVKPSGVQEPPSLPLVATPRIGSAAKHNPMHTYTDDGSPTDQAYQSS